MALPEQTVYFEGPGNTNAAAPVLAGYPKSKRPQPRLSRLEPGTGGTAGFGGAESRATRPSYLAGRSRARPESVRAAPPGARSRAGAAALYSESDSRARWGPRAGPASERPAPGGRPAPPGHSCKWPNPPDEANSSRLPAAAGGPGLPAVAAAPEPSGLPSPDRMEADGDREELSHLRSVFAACDANRSGRLEREEFGALCAELRVRPADAEAVFQRLDADRDGAITFQELARGFSGFRRRGRCRGWAPRDPAPASAQAGPDSEDSEEDEGDGDALAAPGGRASPGQAWQDFQARLGDEAKFIPRCVCGLEGGR